MVNLEGGHLGAMEPGAYNLELPRVQADFETQ